MNTLYLVSYETKKDGAWIFETVATTDKKEAIRQIELDERYGVEEMDCLVLDDNYPNDVSCYWYEEDKHLRRTFASYREKIAEHYEGNIEFSKQWDLFQDEFGLDI